MMMRILLPLLYLTLPSSSWRQEPVITLDNHPIVFDGPTVYTRYSRSSVSASDKNNQRNSPDSIRYPIDSDNNQGFSSNSATYPGTPGNSQGFGRGNVRAPASSSSNQGFASASSTNSQGFVPLSSNSNQRFFPIASSNNQLFIPVSSTKTQTFSSSSSSSSQTFATVSSNINHGYPVLPSNSRRLGPNIARAPASSSNIQIFDSEITRTPNFLSNNQGFAPRTTSTTPAPRQVYTTESTPKRPSGNEDQSANIIPNGPSRCVWAIVSCCTPRSDQVRNACFETLGCQGPFWDTNPCDGHITQYAAKAAVNFYETG